MVPEHTFDDFVRARSAALLRTSYALTGDWGHAEDLLQDVLERMHPKWRSIRDSPDAYARRALVNHASSRWRHRGRRPRERAWATHDDGPTLADPTDALATRDLLVQALVQLPARQRAAVVLRYLDDLTSIEAAAVLGCSIGTVKSQASRGVARLREVLGAIDESALVEARHEH